MSKPSDMLLPFFTCKVFSLCSSFFILVAPLCRSTAHVKAVRISFHMHLICKAILLYIISFEIHIQVAFYHAVVELALFISLFAEEFLELFMWRDYIARSFP